MTIPQNRIAMMPNTQTREGGSQHEVCTCTYRHSSIFGWYNTYVHTTRVSCMFVHMHGHMLIEDVVQQRTDKVNACFKHRINHSCT